MAKKIIISTMENFHENSVFSCMIGSILLSLLFYFPLVKAPINEGSVSTVSELIIEDCITDNRIMDT